MHSGLGLAVCLLPMAAAACHSHSPVVAQDAPILVDAGPPPNCWPIETSMPRGSVELGARTADLPFADMPDQVQLVYGPQGGFDIAARSLIHGLAPGDPNDVSNPGNPRTRFLAYFENGDPNTNVKCGLRYGYIPQGGDTSLFQIEAAIIFDTLLGPDDLFNKRFRVTVEVIDATGGYAMAEKTVTAIAPVDWYQDAGVGSGAASGD